LEKAILGPFNNPPEPIGHPYGLMANGDHVYVLLGSGADGSDSALILNPYSDFLSSLPIDLPAYTPGTKTSGWYVSGMDAAVVGGKLYMGTVDGGLNVLTMDPDTVYEIGDKFSLLPSFYPGSDGATKVVDVTPDMFTASIPIPGKAKVMGITAAYGKVYIASGDVIMQLDPATDTITREAYWTPAHTDQGNDYYGPAFFTTINGGMYVTQYDSSQLYAVDSTLFCSGPPASSSSSVSSSTGPCGNGVTEEDEQCDDGSKNGTSGDGCKTDCTLAPGWTCSLSPVACPGVNIPAPNQPRGCLTSRCTERQTCNQSFLTFPLSPANAITSAGNKLYLASGTGIFVVDSGLHALQQIISVHQKLGFPSAALVVNGKAIFSYVTGNGPDAIVIIDTSNDSLEKAIIGPFSDTPMGHPYGLMANGDHVYVLLGSGADGSDSALILNPYTSFLNPVPVDLPAYTPGTKTSGWYVSGMDAAVVGGKLYMGTVDGGLNVLTMDPDTVYEIGDKFSLLPSFYPGSDGATKVVDVTPDMFTASIPIPGKAKVMGITAAYGKVYIASGDVIMQLDPATDTITREAYWTPAHTDQGNDYYGPAFFTTINGGMYVTQYDSSQLYAVDSTLFCSGPPASSSSSVFIHSTSSSSTSSLSTSSSSIFIISTGSSSSDGLGKNVCGNGILEPFEYCGEPGAPVCSEGMICQNCYCVPNIPSSMLCAPFCQADGGTSTRCKRVCGDFGGFDPRSLLCKGKSVPRFSCTLSDPPNCTYACGQ
jgi:cysteine-rich repeat protein